MNRLLTGLALALSIASVQAQETGKSILLPINCGDWFTPELGGPGKFWLLGFLTGLNEAWDPPDGRKNPLKAISSNAQVILWMDNYCKANPLQTVRVGAIVLFSELIDKGRGSK